MDKIFEYLYSRFLLRDLLAKVLPGLISLISLITIFSQKPSHLFQLLGSMPDLLLILFIYGLSFMFGMLLQYVAMRIGFIVIHVWPGKKGISRKELSLLMAQKFILSPSSNDHLARVRERYTILKEMSGNFAATFSVSLLSIIIRYFLYKSPKLTVLYVIVPLLALLIYLLCKQNRYHAEEQKLWETFLLVDP